MNTTAKNSKSGSTSKPHPRPMTRNRTQHPSLNHNRPQSRNNRLLTNVTEIKDGSKRLHEKLDQMQRVSEAQCEELKERLKKTDGKEIDDLKGLLKKCNDENEEKDEKITKYEETIRKVMESYTKDKEKFKEYLTEIKQQLKACNEEKEEKDEIITKLNKELESCKREKYGRDYSLLMSKYEDNQKLLDEYHASNKLLKSKIKELEKNGSMNMNELEKCKEEKEENRKLNKELEESKKIITNHESIYLDLLAKYDNQKKTIQKMATNYDDLKDVYDKLNLEKYISEQSIFSDKTGKSQVEPLDLYDPSELNKYTPSELKELLISTRRAKKHAFGKGSVLYNKSRPLTSELRELNISSRRKKGP